MAIDQAASRMFTVHRARKLLQAWRAELHESYRTRRPGPVIYSDQDVARDIAELDEVIAGLSTGRRVAWWVAGILAVAVASYEVGYALGMDDVSIPCAKLLPSSWITEFVHTFAGQ